MKLEEIWGQGAVMPTALTRPTGEETPSPAFDELDRVKLKKAVSDKGRMLAPGLKGTVVLCYGTKAYEVEFDTIDGDFFQIPAKDLEKI